jgi:autotransporter adhesin
MATVTRWSNVQVAIQSSLATAVTLTGITKANPGVLSWSTGTDPTNADYIVLSSQGMYEVDGRVFRVANVNGAGNTAELEGENTTSYTTFTSGSFQVITFGTTLSTLTGLQASGGDFDFIDTTTIHSNVRTQIPGAASPATYSFESIWDPADSGLVALKAASDSQALRAIRFTFASGAKVVFNGYVGATLLPTGSAGDKVVTNVTITMFGRPTTYSS